jgi:hypothetical protein
MELWVSILLILISFVIFGGDVTLVFHQRRHYQKNVTKIILVLIALVASTLAWASIIFFKGSYGPLSETIVVNGVSQTVVTTTTMPNFFSGLFTALGDAVKMFALSISNSDFPAYFINQLYSVSGEWVLFIGVFVDELVAFLFISYAIVTIAFQVASSIRKNHKAYRRAYDKNDRYIDYIFTDLTYGELEDFLEYSHAKNNQVVVVLSPVSQLTQAGTEMKSALLTGHYQVSVGPARQEYLAWLSRRCNAKKKIRFYACYQKDIDAIKFADAALAYCKTLKAKGPKGATAIRNLCFYIYHQDPDFEKKYNYGKDSNGLISFFSEYEWAATKFVFQEPLSRLYQVNFLDPRLSNSELQSAKNFHVELLGFGGINQAMIRKMIPAYVTPGDAQLKVKYHVVHRNGSSEGGDASLSSVLARFQATTNKEGFLPPMPLPPCTEEFRDLTDEAELTQYVRSLEDEVIGVGEQALIVIALGSSETNVAVATKIRDLLTKHDLEISDSTREKRLLRNSRYKSVVIAPYVKERALFAPDFSAMPQDIETFRSGDPKAITLAIENHRLYVFEPKANLYNCDATLPKGIKDSVESGSDLRSFSKHNERRWTEKDFKDYRYWVYCHDSVPVVAFGRGGYFVDDTERRLVSLAKRASAIYFYEEPEAKEPIQPSFLFLGADEVEKEWAGAALASDRPSNFAHVTLLPEKLAMFGYKIERVPTRDHRGGNQAVIDQMNLETIKALLDIQKKMKEPSPYKDSAKSLKEALLLEIKDLPIKLDTEKGPFTKGGETARDYLIQRLLLEVNELVCGCLSKQEQATLEKSKLSFGDPRYPNWDLIKKKIDPKQKEIRNYLTAIFRIIYLVPTSMYASVLANLEHNRWYYSQADGRVVPMPINKFKIAAMKEIRPPFEKTSLKDVHECETNNEGLTTLRGDLLLNLAYSPLNFSSTLIGKKPEDVQSDPAFTAYKKAIIKKFKKIYDLTYWYDIFTIEKLSAMLGSVEGMNSKKIEFPPNASPRQIAEAMAAAGAHFDFALTPIGGEYPESYFTQLAIAPLLQESTKEIALPFAKDCLFVGGGLFLPSYFPCAFAYQRPYGQELVLNVYAKKGRQICGSLFAPLEKNKAVKDFIGFHEFDFDALTPSSVSVPPNLVVADQTLEDSLADALELRKRGFTFKAIYLSCLDKDREDVVARLAQDDVKDLPWVVLSPSSFDWVNDPQGKLAGLFEVATNCLSFREEEVKKAKPVLPSQKLKPGTNLLDWHNLGPALSPLLYGEEGKKALTVPSTFEPDKFYTFLTSHYEKNEEDPLYVLAKYEHELWMVRTLFFSPVLDSKQADFVPLEELIKNRNREPEKFQDDRAVSDFFVPFFSLPKNVISTKAGEDKK